MATATQVQKNLQAAMREALRIQDRFVAEPLFAKTGRGYLKSEGVSTISKIKSSLRRDHKGFNPLEPEFEKPWGFFASGMQTPILVRDFIKDNHGFSVMVAHTDTPFNPIADYIVDSDKAEEMAKKGIGRDLAGIMRDSILWALKTFH